MPKTQEWWRIKVPNEIAILAALAEYGTVYDEHGHAQMELHKRTSEFANMARSTFSNIVSKLAADGVVDREKTSAVHISNIGLGSNWSKYQPAVEELIAHKSEIKLLPVRARNVKYTPQSNTTIVKAIENVNDMEIDWRDAEIFRLKDTIRRMAPFLREYDLFQFITRGQDIG